MRYSDRMNHIEGSKIRALFEVAQRIPDVIDLSIGQADFEVPDAIKAGAIDAIRSGCGRYTTTLGLPELRGRVKRDLMERHGLPDTESVIITSGTTGALSLALFALVSPGDEVLIPNPHFVAYDRQVRLAGGVPVLYDLYPDFRLRREAIESKITEKCRVLILNSPANPTGATATASELEAVGRVARAHGLVVVSDELYERFAYDAPHASIKQLAGVDSLLIGGFSKAFAMGGWRVGFAAGPTELIEHMGTLQQFLYTCASTPAQHGVMQAWDVRMAPYIDAYRRKRDLAVEALGRAKYRLTAPTGAFFAFPEVPFGDDAAFCDEALKHKLALVPGRAFGDRTTHFRLSFAASDNTLARGLEVLRRLHS